MIMTSEVNNVMEAGLRFDVKMSVYKVIDYVLHGDVNDHVSYTDESAVHNSIYFAVVREVTNDDR